jgi:hypothetical protein
MSRASNSGAFFALVRKNKKGIWVMYNKIGGVCLKGNVSCDTERFTFVSASKSAAHLKNEAGDIVAKKCTPCDQMLPLEDFGSDKRGLAGKRGFCRTCDTHRKKNNGNGLDIYGNPKKPSPKHVERVYNKYGMVIAKTCPRCDDLKSRSEFYEQSSATDVLSIHCKTCHGERVREWARANPEKCRTYGHNRRAKERALPGDLTDEQWMSALEYFDYSCALTGVTENLAGEHAIPLKIGRAGTVFWNMYPLESTLNSSKGDKHLFLWAQSRSDIDKQKFNRLICYLADMCELTVDEYREFYDWCFLNPRFTVEEIEADGDVDSLFLWRKMTNTSPR